MKIFIIIYLTLGLLFNFFGPLAKFVKRGLLQLESNDITNIITGKPTASNFKKKLFEAILRLLVLLLYPLVFILVLLDKKQ